MKKIIFLTAMLFLAYQGYSQYSLKGRFQANLGAGISNYGAPVYLSLDYGLLRDFTIGIEGNLRSTGETYYPNLKIVGMNGNINYHFNHLLQFADDRFDFYAGVYYNYWLVSPTMKAFKQDSASMGYGGQVGMRYFISEHFGIHIEASAGKLDKKAYLSRESSINGGLKVGFCYRF